MPHLVGSEAQSGMNSELKIEHINRSRKVIMSQKKKAIENCYAIIFFFYFQAEVIQ